MTFAANAKFAAKTLPRHPRWNSRCSAGLHLVSHGGRTWRRAGVSTDKWFHDPAASIMRQAPPRAPAAVNCGGAGVCLERSGKVQRLYNFESDHASIVCFQRE